MAGAGWSRERVSTSFHSIPRYQSKQGGGGQGGLLKERPSLEVGGKKEKGVSGSARKVEEVLLVYSHLQLGEEGGESTEITWLVITIRRGNRKGRGGDSVWV